jgi:transposase
MELKYSLGLDISMEDIKACLCVIDDTQEVKVVSSAVFLNTKKGVLSMITWFNKSRKDKTLPHTITMEPTGVYYETCAYSLHRSGFRVSVVVASLVKNYLLSLGFKTKNDKIDARGIAIMGAQRKLQQWSPPNERIMQLRTLTRHHQALQERLTATRNQLHAEQKSEIKSDLVINQLELAIEFDQKQIETINKGICKLIKSDLELKRKFDIVLKIKGVGMLTAATVVAEYGGFELFSNYKQVISFAGYDVVENQSGKHQGNTRISKKGNSRVRRILFMPAFVAIQNNEKQLTALFERVLLRNGDKLKMKAYVAVQKKILIYIYYAWNKEIDYSEAKILKQEQVTTSPLDFEKVWKTQTDSTIKEKSSHISVAAQGRNPVNFHSITPHR